MRLRITSRPATYLIAVLAAASLSAQVRVRVEAGGRMVMVAPEGAGAADGGVPVQMFESPNLDRYLRKAQDLIARADHAGAIKVLQDVVEGRTLFDAGALAEPGRPVPEPGERQPFDEDDPAHAVFSSDERLYRPVRRLCQELLAALPPQGIALYREKHEAAARALFEQGLRARDVHALERVFERYFVTVSAALALNAAGDVQMHQARYRGAIQTWRTLLEVYPAAARTEITGLSDVAVSVKIVLCLMQLGERARAAELLESLQAQHPDATVRVMGELVRVADLRRSELFAGAIAGAPRTTAPQPLALRAPVEDFVPVWEHRFFEPDPYQAAQRTRSSQVFMIEGQADGGAAPRPDFLSPGSSVAFSDGEVLFLDHFRVRVGDLRTGMLRRESEGELGVPKPDASRARNRYALYDQVAQRVVEDEARYYAIVGRAHAGNPIDPLLRNDLVACDRTTMAQVWSSEEWRSAGASAAGDYRDVTFLAAPTVFGQRLLVPILTRGIYALQCVDATNGEPLFRAHLHHGGSPLARAPSAPVALHKGIAYVLTNAGTVGAVDAFTGSTLWIRKYEREHPLRPPTPGRRPNAHAQLVAGTVYREIATEGFAPSDLIAIEGRLIVAPADGSVLLCLDGASGEILWLLSRPYRSAYVLGHNGAQVLLAGGEQVMCIDLRTGVRQWSAALPAPSAWHGRGFVLDDLIAVPGDRCVYTLPLRGNGAERGAGEWQRIPLRTAAVGAAPLEGASNLFVHGPYLVACYEGGIELHASLQALHELAQQTEDPEARAGWLTQAGDLVAAVAALEGLIADAARPEPERARAARRALPLVRDVALAMAAHAARAESLAMLQRCAEWPLSRGDRLQWQLARIEVLVALGDETAASVERDALYAMMEGRK
jgi:tetratricopeptide (TPR) repeat protein